MKTAGMESVFRFGAVLSIPHCAQSRGGLSGHQDEIDDILYILVSYQRMRHPGDAFSKREGHAGIPYGFAKRIQRARFGRRYAFTADASRAGRCYWFTYQSFGKTVVRCPFVWSDPCAILNRVHVASSKALGG